MQLILLRHGQSVADILNVIEGRADFELTLYGKIQVEETAKSFPDYIKLTKYIHRH